MMKLKIQAFITAFVIFTSCFYSITMAQETVGNWTLKCYGAAEADGSAEIISDPTLIYDGAGVLKMVYKAVARDDNNYVEAKNVLKQNMTTGRYTLKFYNKANAAPTTDISIGDQIICGFADMEVKAAVAPSGVSGWSEYTYTFDYMEQEESFLAFRVYSRTTSELIDNVSLTKEGSDENLVYNGGFEENDSDDGDDDGDDEDDEDDDMDTTDYQPKCMLASPSNGIITLSWRNPATEALEKIKIYDMTGEKEELLSEDVSTESGKTVWYKISGLENGTNYLYKVVFCFKDEADKIYFLGASPDPNSIRVIGNWDFIEQKGGTAGYCPATVEIDYNEAHGGNASVRMTSNIDYNIEEFRSNIYVELRRRINMELGKKYRFSFWIKRNNVQRRGQFHMDWAPFENQDLVFEDMIGSGDWEKREYDYIYQEKNTLTILMDGLCEGLWLDDITVFELDDNGNPTGENLLPEGDFETIYSDETGKITNITVEEKPGGAKLSWVNPASRYNGLKIYREVSGKYEYRGILNSGFNELNISGLENGKEYKYKLVPFNSDGYCGEECEISFTSVLPGYEISELILRKDGVRTENLIGSGDYSVTLPIKNNIYEDNFGCVQLVAVYQNNVLIKLYSTEQVIPKTQKNASFTDVVTEFEVPEGDGYCVQVFVIDSRTEWNTLCPMVNY